MNQQAESDIRRKLRAIKYGKEIGNVAKACRYYGISRDTYYRWKRDLETKGEEGLINQKPCPENPKIRVAKPIEEKILYLRTNYHLGPQKIRWYLERYHGMTVSATGVRGVLLRHNLNRLPKHQRKRSMPEFKRYEKQVPGHRIQVDVKFLKFKDKSGKQVKRFQYTAIDDATRIRALKIYNKHTQINAIKFIDYVTEKFPFRIHTVQTDNGHEFQAKFHWHLEDLGIRHVYIKPGTPRLNGKVERSHKSDKEEFYQLIEYKGDVDLSKKLQTWEAFYNYHRAHGGLNGSTPYEVLKKKLKLSQKNNLAFLGKQR